MGHKIFRDGKVYVAKEMCATCIFRPGNLMHLRPGCLRQIVDDAIADDSAIVCHETIGTKKHCCCRGYFDRHKHNVLPLRLALHMGVIEEQVMEPAQTSRKKR